MTTHVRQIKKCVGLFVWFGFAKCIIEQKKTANYTKGVLECALD